MPSVNRRDGGRGGGDYLDNHYAEKEALGDFGAGDAFGKINAKPGGGLGNDSPTSELGESGIPVAGERSADAAIRRWGPLAAGRCDKTDGGKAVTLPTLAGGPLPQDTPKGV